MDEVTVWRQKARSRPKAESSPLTPTRKGPLQRPRKRSLANLLTRSDRQSSGQVGSVASDVSSASVASADKGDLGLTTLYTPKNPSSTVADIIFIHGLGGGSRKTWSYSADDYHYWPQSWLSSDPDFEDVRLHVFGYQADWAERRQGALNINDFAQYLLGEIKNDPGIRRDTTPLILVSHSVDGFVAKKTYNLACQDPACAQLVDRIHSMFFLGTPHRGLNLAPILNNILTLAWGRNPFVTELLPNSNALMEINEVFRHYASRLDICSFYETLPVKTGSLNRLIVEKDMSILGYPSEMTAAMNADHRHVCKFEGPTDPNYRLLRNALHMAVYRAKAFSAGKFPEQLSSKTKNHVIATDSAGTSRLLSFLGLSHTLGDDSAAQITVAPGSGDWLTYSSWVDGNGPQILWLTGPAASGKSVLSKLIARRLKYPKVFRSYFAFQDGNNNLSTLRDCFRAIAYQSALQDTFVRRKFLHLAHGAVAWGRSDEESIWRRLIVGVVFQSPLISRHVWIIDGIDECSDVNTLFTKFLATIPPDLRVFATSRSSGSITQGLATLGSRVYTHAISVEDTAKDMRIFVTAKLTDMGQIDARDDEDGVRDKILQKSGHDFLLAELYTHEIEKSWTREAMESTLQDAPSNLEDFYRRILKSIELDPHAKVLAKSILTWVSIASRPLTVDELRCAIWLDIQQTIRNVAKAIPSLCGQLVYVDGKNRVQMIHATMRQFLLSKDMTSDLAVQRTSANTRMALLLVRCLSGLQAKCSPTSTSRSTKTTVEPSPDVGLLAYATNFFSDHMYRSASKDDVLMGEICPFLKRQNVLYWIEQIARGQDLSLLKKAAANLRGYIHRRATHLPSNDPQVQFVNGWVVDLMKVATKFQIQLVSCPSAIHQLVPPLCPPHSNIARSFATRPRLSPLAVKNLPDGSWDDCLVQIDFSKGHSTAIAHGDDFFAVGLSTGQIILYNAASFQKLRDLVHPEGVRLLQLSQGGEYLISCGNAHMTAWGVKNGNSIFTGRLASVPLSAVFMGDKEVLTTSRTSEVTKWNLLNGTRMSTSWLDGDYFDLLGETLPDQSPSKATFSEHLPRYDVLLAIGYHSDSVLIFEPLEMQLLSVCEIIDANGIEDMVFNNNADVPTLAVSCTDGRLCIFSYESGRLDFSTPNVYASSLSCSKDGLHLVCGSSQGSISLYKFDQSHDASIFLTPIHRINTLPECIKRVAFHSDGRRFVDITRQQCRVWEPMALAQIFDEGASTSDVLSVARRTDQDVPAPDLPRISTPLATSLYGGLMAAANSLRQVVLFSADDGREIGTAYAHADDAWIRLVALGHLGALIASADDSGRVIVAELPLSLRAAPNSETVAGQNLSSIIVIDRSFGASVSQLFFNPDDTRFLVISDFMELFELPGGKLLRRQRLIADPSPAAFDEASHTQPANNTPFAVQHPEKPDCFIVMLGLDFRIFTWNDLEELTPSQGIRLQYPADCALHIPATVAYHSIPRQGVLGHRTPQRGFARLIFWPLTAFDMESAACGQHATYHVLYMIGPLVGSILGGMTGNKVVFLGKDLWICSFELHTPSDTRNHGLGSGPRSLSSGAGPTDKSIVSNIRRHFFAMNEWRDGNNSLSCLKIPVPTGPYRKEGYDFAFIARDRVIVIQSGLDFSEVIKVSQGPPAVSKEGELSQIDDADALSTPTPQWTMVSGSMHRRALD